MRAGISMGGPSRTFDWMVTVCVCLFSSGLATGNESVPKTISSAFEATVVQLSVKPNDKAVDAVWNYTNHWEIPLLIERFDQSCGCLSGKVAPSGHEAVAPESDVAGTAIHHLQSRLRHPTKPAPSPY